MFIKRDRFLGKFKKGPPHIGEYEKKVHFQGGKSPMVNYSNLIHAKLKNPKCIKKAN